MSDKLYLTSHEAAELLGITVDYLYKLTSKRVIPHYKPSGKILVFKRTEIEEYIENTRVASLDEVFAASAKHKRHAA